MECLASSAVNAWLLSVVASADWKVPHVGITWLINWVLAGVVLIFNSKWLDAVNVGLVAWKS